MSSTENLPQFEMPAFLPAPGDIAVLAQPPITPRAPVTFVTPVAPVPFTVPRTRSIAAVPRMNYVSSVPLSATSCMTLGVDNIVGESNPYILFVRDEQAFAESYGPGKEKYQGSTSHAAPKPYTQSRPCSASNSTATVGVGSAGGKKAIFHITMDEYANLKGAIALIDSHVAYLRWLGNNLADPPSSGMGNGFSGNSMGRPHYYGAAGGGGANSGGGRHHGASGSQGLFRAPSSKQVSSDQSGVLPDYSRGGGNAMME